MGRKKIYQTEEERKAAQKEAYKRWYEKNKAAQAAWHKQWYQDNKTEWVTKMKQYNSTPFGRAVNLVGSYKQNDIKYNRGECTVTAEWIIDNVFSGQCCHYCGESDFTIILSGN